jgi:hypothetical protein
MSIAAGLKNEGLFFAVCLSVAFVMVAAGVTGIGLKQAFVRFTDRRLIVVLLVSLTPIIAWAIYKRSWGLENDLTGQPLGAWARMEGRLADGTSAGYLFEYLTIDANGIWMLSGLVVITALFSIRERVRLHPGAVTAALTAVLYFCGLYVIYLSSPYEFDFHLPTSATRTMASTRIALLVSMFFLLSNLEAGPDRHQGRRTDAAPSAMGA